MHIGANHEYRHERIPVLVTKTQKQRLMARAKAAGLSTGEFLRRAAESYSPSEDEVLLEGLLNKSPRPPSKRARHRRRPGLCRRLRTAPG